VGRVEADTAAVLSGDIMDEIMDEITDERSVFSEDELDLIHGCIEHEKYYKLNGVMFPIVIAKMAKLLGITTDD
jgi:hypothetical protein